MSEGRGELILMVLHAVNNDDMVYVKTNRFPAIILLNSMSRLQASKLCVCIVFGNLQACNAHVHQLGHQNSFWGGPIGESIEVHA